MATRTITASMTLPALTMSASVGIASPKTITASMTLPALTMSASVGIASPKTITASMTLPALSMGAALEVIGAVHCHAVLSLGAMVTVSGLIRIKPARHASWPYHVQQRSTVTLAVQAHGSRELRTYALRYELWLSTTYDVRYIHPVYVHHTVRTPLRLQTATDIDCGHTAPSRLALSVAYGTAPKSRAIFALDYGPAARVMTALDMDYGPAARVMTALDMDYGPAARVMTALDMDYGTARMVRRVLSAAYRLLAPQTRAVHDVSCDITTDARVRAAHTTAYGIDAQQSPVIVPAPTIRCPYGRVLRLSLGQGIDTVLWRASATVVTDAEPKAGDVLDITIDTLLWRLQITSARLSVLHPEAVYDLQMQSAAPPISQQPIRQRADRDSLHGGLASDLVRALWPGVTVHWGVTDDVITPPQMHTLWDVTASDATVALARACGGIAIVSPDASRIDVLPPLSGTHVATAPIEYQGTATPQPAIELASAAPMDAISVRAIAADRAEVTVTPNPRRPVSLTVTEPHAILSVTPATETRDELIELRDGVGSVSAPIADLVSAQVYPAATLRYRGSDVWIDTPAHAAARVIYRAHVLRAIVTGTPHTSSIAIVEDPT
jgi:hypothetical protein